MRKKMQQRNTYCSNNPISKVDSNGHWYVNNHNSTYSWARSANFSKNAAEKIKDYCTTYDTYPSHSGKGHWTPGWGRATGISRAFQAYYKRAKDNKSLKYMGWALHCLQDYYCLIHYHKFYRKKTDRKETYHHAYSRPYTGTGAAHYGNDCTKHHPYRNWNEDFTTCLLCKVREVWPEHKYNMHVTHQHRSWIEKRWYNTRDKSKYYLKEFKKIYG